MSIIYAKTILGILISCQYSYLDLSLSFIKGFPPKPQRRNYKKADVTQPRGPKS